MAYEQKDNSGSIFKNDRKEQPNHPDYKGQALIDGKEYWVSVWLKNVNVAGKKPFMSLAFNPKEARDDGPVMDRGQSGGSSYAPNLDDEVPFGPCR